MTHLIRILAGLPFRVLSPSLYALMMDTGTVAFRYNGKAWEIVTFTCDAPEQVTIAGTFKQAVETLDLARLALVGTR